MDPVPAERPSEELNAPNHTIYINNLNEKVKIEELKQALFFLFSQCGEIIDIIAKKNIKMRGQAFIIFKELKAAETAVKDLQNCLFFDKPMKLNFAKTKSDAIAKREGTYVPRERPKVKLDDKITQKKIKPDQPVPMSRVAPTQNPMQRAPLRQTIVPNNILFIENLPEATTEEMLIPVFSHFPGFREVRLIASKRVAFVEYEDDLQAGIAMSGLQGRDLIEGFPLQITYAKK